MKFIDVRTDFAFKKVFSSKDSKEILMSFLNALLDFGENPIVDLTIVQPYQVPILVCITMNFIEIHASLSNGARVVIEVQVLSTPGFNKRILSNVARSYSNQLKDNDPYAVADPVIGLSIADCVMFKDPELESVVISHFQLLEKDQFFTYSDDITLVFVELPKFRKTETELTSMRDKWIYFVKHAGNLKYIPPILANEELIYQAFTIANTTNLTAEEKEIQTHKIECLIDQRAILERAEQAENALIETQEALDEAKTWAKTAVEQERKEGHQQGLEEGLIQGKKAATLEVAKKMLQANIDMTLIQQVTYLQPTEIEELKVEVGTINNNYGAN